MQCRCDVKRRFKWRIVIKTFNALHASVRTDEKKRFNSFAKLAKQKRCVKGLVYTGS